MDEERDDTRRSNGQFGPGNPGGGRPKGSPNKLNKTIKEAMSEAAENLGGKKGATGVFEQAGKKDIVAFANMLTRHLPLEIQQEYIGGVDTVNIISVPPGHMFCPDNLLRPTDEAKKLWEEHRARCGVDDDAQVLRVEPEIAELIARATKGDDPAA